MQAGPLIQRLYVAISDMPCHGQGEHATLQLGLYDLLEHPLTPNMNVIYFLCNLPIPASKARRDISASDLINELCKHLSQVLIKWPILDIQGPNGL